MSNTLLALVVLFAVLGGLGLFFRHGQLSFWKLAAELPDEAFEYISRDPTWVVHQASQPTPGEGYAGPFLLAVPSLGQIVTLYAREGQIEASQRGFVAAYHSRLPRRGFPYLSLLALLYPALAILSMAKSSIPLTHQLGYGFANLGYLLGVATVVPGHFRVLGLDYRLQTFLAALFFWLGGFALSNIGS